MLRSGAYWANKGREIEMYPYPYNRSGELYNFKTNSIQLDWLHV